MRVARVSAVVTVVTLLAALVSLPASARSPEERATLKGVSLQVSSKVVAAGHKVRLSGAAPVGRGAMVTIWQLTLSTGRWGVEGTTRTGRSGTFHYSEVVHRGDRVYKACVRKGGKSLCSKGRRVDLVKERRYSISATASAPTYSVGQQVVITGTVKPSARGDRLKLMRSVGGSDSVGSVVATGRVGDQGRFTLTAPAEAGSWDYYVVKPKTAVGRSAMSGFVGVDVAKAGVVLAVGSVSPTTLEAGQTVTVSGASINLVGQTVFLQAYDAATSKFSSIGSAVVDPAGNWSIATPLLQAGKAVQLQVVAPETATTAAGSIGAGSVAVYGWYYLRDWSSVQGSFDEYGAIQISGTTYAKSLAEENSENIQYDLARSCTKFAATVGLADYSYSTSKSSLRILADSTERYANGNLTLGTAYPVALDVTGALRIVFDIVYVAGDPYTAFGDARVLCAF